MKVLYMPFHGWGVKRNDKKPLPFYIQGKMKFSHKIVEMNNSCFYVAEVLT